MSIVVRGRGLRRVLPGRGLVAVFCWGWLAVVAPLQAAGLPSLVDERHPAQPASAPESREERQRESGARVTLPDASDADRRAREVPVAHIRFHGGTVFELDDLARELRPMVGRRVTVGELADAVERITRRYQEAGYPLSFAYLPADNFQDGIVTVVLVEGFVAQTELEIAREPVRRRVDRLAEQVVGERPLTRATFERYTALMGRIPGAELSVNAPVPRTPGGATTLRVEEQRTRWVTPGLTIEGDDVDDFRLLASLAFQSTTRYADQLALAALLPVDDDEAFYAAEYSQELGADGWRVSVAASRYDTEDADDLFSDGDGAVRESRVADRYRIGLEYPLVLSARLLWAAGIEVGHHREQSQVDYDGQLELDRHLHFSAAGLDTRLMTGRDGRIVELRADVRRGVDLGDNRNDWRLVSTEGEAWFEQPEELEFLRFGLGARWVQPLGATWRFSARADGFWSGDALPSPERGNYGGTARFGRGYSDNQAQGDYGAAGEVELRYVHGLQTRWLRSLEPYVVVDGARTRYQEREVEHELASAALGLELARGRAYRLRVEYARPVADRDAGSGQRDGRVNVRLAWDLSG